MQERIQQIIDSEGITAAEFADSIGVQRSNVSHVLNGRNNPGFSFIQKILESYPNVNSRWLLTGSGSIYESGAKKEKVQAAMPDLFSTIETKPQTTKQEPLLRSETNSAPKVEQKQALHEEVKQKTEEEKTVARVLIFYSDHTFDDYRPAK
jgi:transcriptional regulator with XRE-family HTH domain